MFYGTNNLIVGHPVFGVCPNYFFLLEYAAIQNRKDVRRT